MKFTCPACSIVNQSNRLTSHQQCLACQQPVVVSFQTRYSKLITAVNVTSLALLLTTVFFLDTYLYFIPYTLIAASMLYLAYLEHKHDWYQVQHVECAMNMAPQRLSAPFKGILAGIVCLVWGAFILM